MVHAPVGASTTCVEAQSGLELTVLDLSRADDPAQAEAFRRHLLRAAHELGFSI